MMGEDDKDEADDHEDGLGLSAAALAASAPPNQRARQKKLPI